jgi:hypothetical protein
VPTVVGAHSHVDVPGSVSLADVTGIVTFTASDNSHIYYRNLHFYSDAGATTTPIAVTSVHVTVTETASAHVNFGSHVQNVHVSPQQEVTNF